MRCPNLRHDRSILTYSCTRTLSLFHSTRANNSIHDMHHSNWHLRTDIEQTLLKIDDVAGSQEDLSAEEMLILRGSVSPPTPRIQDSLTTFVHPPPSIFIFRSRSPPWRPVAELHSPSLSTPISPQPGQLHLYREAVERLNANIAFKGDAGEEGARIAELVETGAKKLTGLFTKLVAEGSSGTSFTSLPSMHPD